MTAYDPSLLTPYLSASIAEFQAVGNASKWSIQYDAWTWALGTITQDIVHREADIPGIEPALLDECVDFLGRDHHESVCMLTDTAVSYLKRGGNIPWHRCLTSEALSVRLLLCCALLCDLPHNNRTNQVHRQNVVSLIPIIQALAQLRQGTAGISLLPSETLQHHLKRMTFALLRLPSSDVLPSITAFSPEAAYHSILLYMHGESLHTARSSTSLAEAESIWRDSVRRWSTESRWLDRPIDIAGLPEKYVP